MYYLVPGLIDVWLSTVGMAWLAPLFTALWGSQLNAQQLCRSGPPALPPPDFSTLEASIATAWQYLYAVAWPNVCQCVPGAPAPTPFPDPNWTPPTGWPVLPTIACNNLDLCATIADMAQQLLAVQRQLTNVDELVTLLQRYSLPFGYVLGSAHPGLTASGSIAMPRLLGVRAEITTPNVSTPPLEGNPPYLWDQGWLSWDTPDGMLEEKRLTRTDQIWLPRGAALGGTFKWALRTGVVMTATEVEAEV